MTIKINIHETVLLIDYHAEASYITKMCKTIECNSTFLSVIYVSKGMITRGRFRGGPTGAVPLEMIHFLSNWQIGMSVRLNLF